MTRVGIVGLGRIGLMHASLLARHDRVRELVLLGRRPEKLKAVAQEFVAAGEPVTVTQRILDRDWTTGLDAVVIASATDSHPSLLRTVAAAGVPVLVEKPVALELAEQEQLAVELARVPAPIMVGFHRRYDAGYQGLRELIRKEELGTLRALHATSHDSAHIGAEFMATSGGLWRDMAVHDFDLLPWLLGQRVERVFAQAGVLDDPTYAEAGDVDTGHALLEMESGLCASLSVARNIAGAQDVRLEVFGSVAAASTGLDASTPVDDVLSSSGADRGQVHEDFSARFLPAYVREIDHFLRLVEGEVPNLTPLASGIPALRVALAAEESVRTGKLVSVSYPHQQGS